MSSCLEGICHCRQFCNEASKDWIKAFEAREPSKETDDNDLLLAPRVLGYALGRKTWCQFLVNNIILNDPVDDEGDQAKNEGMEKQTVFPADFDEEEQEGVLSMVRNHYAIMAKSVDHRLSDSISGKGESLVLLFHGKIPLQDVLNKPADQGTRRLQWDGENAVCGMVGPVDKTAAI